METQPHSPDSLDLENPPQSTLNINPDLVDDFYENEMNSQLVEIKNNFIQNSPNI